MNATYITFLITIILIASLSNTEGLTNEENNTADMKAEHNQLLKDLTQSQGVEQALYNNLKNGPTDNDNIVNNINKMAEYRTSIFDKLLNLSRKSSTRSPKHDTESKLLDEITNEITLLKQQISSTKNSKPENIKQAEINNYYSERSKAYVLLFKQLFYCSWPLLIISVLMNRRILPSRYGVPLIGIVLLFTIYWGGSIYYDIISRDNMNFNEYDFESNFNTTATSTPPRGFEGSFWATGCTNEDCCAKGSIYDTSKGVCVIPSEKN